jgi:hypothetical protein
MSQTDRPDREAAYEICVKGVLDDSWSAWLGGLDVRPLDNGETVLTGPVRDQAALHGLLSKIRDLGLVLLSLERVRREECFE